MDSMPLVHHGRTNPLTNDTESEVPQAARDQAAGTGQGGKASPRCHPAQDAQAKENSRAGGQRAATVPPYIMSSSRTNSSANPRLKYRARCSRRMPGSGQIGAGKNDPARAPFTPTTGTDPGIIARNWHTGDVDAQIRTAPVVTADFDLMRDGSVSQSQAFANQRNLHPGRFRPARHSGIANSLPSPRAFLATMPRLSFP